MPGSIAIVVLCGAIPLFANYKEHNRGNLWVPWDYAYNLLMSCEPNAILFTNGDNDTFPLWFAQEVAGIRKDVRVVNLSLGNTDWYIKQMLDNEPILKLSYDRAGIDRDMVLSEKNFEHPSQRIEFWVKKAEQAIPTLARQIEILEAKLDSLDLGEGDEIAEDLFKRKLWLQTYTALKEWGEPRKHGIMQTQYKLVMDLTMNNPDKPIHVSTTVGLSNAVGLDKYMVQKGMVWDLTKGDLTPSKDSMDIDRTAYLVDSVFRYRGLGDGTAFINSETEQLLSNYNSIYIRLAMAQKNNFAFENGIHYLDMGIKQFPSEWRNYAFASELLLVSGDSAKAVEYLERGLKTTSAGSGSKYLSQQLNMLKK
jgi:tetratricopeptide (TPR) repeat protein